MEPVHVKEALSLLDRVHLFGVQNKGDRSLQYAMESIINMVEGITIGSQKQTLISICFFHRLVFFITCLCCTVLKFKCSYSKYSLFLHTFSRKMSAYLDRAKKKVKSLKIENFDQTSEKWAPPNSGQF